MTQNINFTLPVVNNTVEIQPFHRPAPGQTRRRRVRIILNPNDVLTIQVPGISKKSSTHIIY